MRFEGHERVRYTRDQLLQFREVLAFVQLLYVQLFHVESLFSFRVHMLSKLCGMLHLHMLLKFALFITLSEEQFRFT